MSIKIIKPREWKVDTQYFWHYPNLNVPGAGCMYPCDKDGVLNLKTESSQKSYADTIASSEYGAPEIITSEHRYVEPAEALCVCGCKVYLEDPMDNECESCGRNYNMSGQEVIPMSMCRDHDDY